MFKKYAIVIYVFLLIFALAGTSQVYTASAAAPPERHIIFTESNASIDLTAQEVSKTGGTVLKAIDLPNRKGLVVSINKSSKDAIARTQGVIAVEPDLIVSAIPVDKALLKTASKGSQPEEVLPWGIKRIKASAIWDKNGDLVTDPGADTGSKVNVAIIDSGIDKDHPDLEGNLAGGINFAVGASDNPKYNSNWNDRFGHGTHVAGICAAVNNRIGVIGAAPGARLWAVRVLDENGSGYLSDFIDGIYWCAKNNMDVANMSVGIPKDVLDQYPNDREALEEAANYAYKKGVLLVAAAGNSGNEAGTGDTMDYPARLSSVLAVAATDSNDVRPYWSSTGPNVGIAAPGVDILSTLNDGFYFTASGTSMASPHVAGTAALVIGTGQMINRDGRYGVANEVREIICHTADKVGDGNLYGNGIVNAKSAVKAVK